MFGKKRKETKPKTLLTSFDLMQTKTVLSSDELLDLCDVILGGRALLANFERIPVAEANRMLAFVRCGLCLKWPSPPNRSSYFFVCG